MRVLHIVTAFPRDEGDVITPWLGQLLLALRADGVDASVLAPSYRGGGATRWRGVPITRYRYAPRRLETLTHDETVPDRLRARPVYAALVPAYLLGGTVAAWRAGLDAPDVIHVHWPFPHAWLGAVARAASGGRSAVVSTFYSVELRWVERRLPALRPFLDWSIESADLVTAISTATARAVAAYTSRPVHVIPFAAALEEGGGERNAGGDASGPADARAAGPRGTETARARPFRLLFVGRLVERKGVDVLVRALGVLGERRAVTLTVIGEGPRAADIRATARRLGLDDRVTLAGRVDDAALRRAYLHADAFVLPAVVDEKGDTEGLGVVLLEALRFGLPVIASRTGGIPDIVRDGETGWLVPPGDAAALAAAIETVAADPAEARRRVARGRVRLDAEFSLPGIVERLGRCYEEAVAARRGRGMGLGDARVAEPGRGSAGSS